MFPAIAVAEVLQALAQADVVFCGTARGVEARVVPARGWPLELLDVEPMKGKGASQAVRAAVVAARATIQANALVGRLRPHVVLSAGGYAAGPVTLAAALRGVPVAVLEPNRVVGLTNRILAPFARRAYVAWDEAATRFRASARRTYGVPVRRGFVPDPYKPRGTARVLVLGGSQGAAALNDRVPDAMARLTGAIGGLSVVHQAGVGRDGVPRDAAVRDAYASRGVEGAVVVAFLDDVARAIAEADVVVARAGAGTIAEITAIGRAAILVPFPHSADDHQGRNAEGLARLGAAVSVHQQEASATRLASEIERVLGDDSLRVSMADAARAHGRPTAAHDVAVDLLALAGAGASRRPTRSIDGGARPLAEEEDG